MKNKIVPIVLVLLLSAFAVFAQTTEFTYQGNLITSGSPATGTYDFEFALYDALAAGTQIGSTLTRSAVAVANGNFAVKLDFGEAFPGANRFLEIHVRPSGGGTYTTLSPRQVMNSTPYSIQSLNAATATSLQIGRTINGTTFDGTSNITITTAAGTLTGATLASGVKNSSLTSVGNLTGLVVNGVANINDNNNAATNIGTGSTTSPVTIGGGSNAVVINSPMSQPLDNSGLLKAAAHIQGGLSPTVSRQFNNLPDNTTITVTYLTVGNYEVDFGTTDISTRFYHATVGSATPIGPQVGQIFVSPRSGNPTALLVRTADPTGLSSNNISFYLLVY